MSTAAIRHDWTRAEIAALLDLPFADLLARAHAIHRAHHDANAVQVSTLLSVKTGGCPEDCAYCPQAARYSTGVGAEKLMSLDAVLEKARQAKAAGASRFCMGAAWRSPKDRDIPRIAAMVGAVKSLGMETCATLGMLTQSQADALKHVAGYAVCNDVSERNFQIERGGNWTKGKSHDTFGPLGPWLVTKDEIPDVQKLSMWLDVNGQRRQTGSTSTMIFSMAKCVSYVSQFITLLPGDIITTGTPPGVGTGMKPPQFLNVGDVVTLGIEGLGGQRQEIIAAGE